MTADVKAIATKMEVTLIVCLIADIEVRSVGSNVKQYEQACAKFGIELFKYPIVEMAPPKDLQVWNDDVVQKVV